MHHSDYYDQVLIFNPINKSDIYKKRLRLECKNKSLHAWIGRATTTCNAKIIISKDEKIEKV